MQVLCIQGFLACRKHADRIILLVEMMQGSGCPAFKAGPRCVLNLRKRFHLNLTETQVSLCMNIVISSYTHSLRLPFSLNPRTFPNPVFEDSLRLWHST